MPKTITQRILNAEPGREWAHKTRYEDGSETITYGPTSDPKDATDLGSKTSAAKPESKSKAEPKAKPTVNSAVKGAAKPATKPLSKPGVDVKNLNRTGILPNAVRKAGYIYKAADRWLSDKFADNVIRPRLSQIQGATLGFNFGSGAGPMPLGKNTVDKLRLEHEQDELSDIDTVVPMNPQGTQYLDPKLGIVDTEVVEDHEGGRYYRNAQTGQFEPLDYNPRYKYYSPLPRVKESYPIDEIPTINDILGGALSMPKSDTPLPIPPMHYDSDANKPLPPMSADDGEIPSGKVVVGPDTETKPVTKPTVTSVVKPKRVSKPTVVNNTPVAKPVSTPTSNVAAPTLSSVTQAVRHNGGFDNYRRESVLSALRAAGGISPAEAVQRGIIPWEALNYV